MIASVLHIDIVKKDTNLIVKAFYDAKTVCKDCMIEIRNAHIVFMHKKVDKNGIARFDVSSLDKKHYNILAKNQKHRKAVGFDIK